MMVAIGDSKSRFDAVQKLPKETIYFTYIHPTALILDASGVNFIPLKQTTLTMNTSELEDLFEESGEDTITCEKFIDCAYKFTL